MIDQVDLRAVDADDQKTTVARKPKSGKKKEPPAARTLEGVAVLLQSRFAPWLAAPSRLLAGQRPPIAASGSADAGSMRASHLDEFEVIVKSGFNQLEKYHAMFVVERLPPTRHQPDSICLHIAPRGELTQSKDTQAEENVHGQDFLIKRKTKNYFIDGYHLAGHDINSHVGEAGWDQLTQELQLRKRRPSGMPDTKGPGYSFSPTTTGNLIPSHQNARNVNLADHLWTRLFSIPAGSDEHLLDVPPEYSGCQCLEGFAAAPEHASAVQAEELQMRIGGWLNCSTQSGPVWSRATLFLGRRERHQPHRHLWCS
ncbi:hypothetical protein QBC42DRAFT_256945 [Cladorrhinum samala]|uniref:Uncharacterized protein n=1 Tax=Cladorrhinum samala TaxID=585594 RepID=A0AAV9H8L9_9PEZI|nr:hypothetical protein QBC42DRAFT_256945 [Cladorrhinum samala]